MDLLRLPQSEDRKLFFATAIALWFFLLAPYIYAYFNTPPKHYCTGIIGYPETEVCDQNFYIAWGPAQAANKHLLFEDKLNGFTDQRLVFNAWWLLTGSFSGWLGMDTYFFNQVQRFVVIPILCLVIFNFTALFFGEKKYKFMAFWLILFSGYNLSPYPEANVFESMLWEVILPVAHIFFFITIYYCHKAIFQNGSVWKAGLASFVMSTIYPYATVSVCFITGCSLLFLLWNKRATIQQAFAQFSIIFLCTIPMVLYDFWIVNSDKRYIEGIANFTSSPVWYFLPAYGLLFALALGGIWLTKKRNASAFYFPAIWLLCTLVQIYFPIQIIPFQIQLILGIQVPMSLLAVFVFREWISQKRNSISLQTENVFYSLLLVSVFITNGYMYLRILNHVSKKTMPVYLENEIVEATQWLKQNTREEEVVISTPIISSYIPVLSHNRIYSSDYFAPTPDFSEKEKNINWLFADTIVKTDSEITAFLTQNRISYIFQNNYHDRQNHALDVELFKENKVLKLVYQNSLSRIYRLNSKL